MANKITQTRRLRDFIAHIADHGKCILIRDVMQRDLMEARSVLVPLTEDMDFGCGFEDGACKRQRRVRNFAKNCTSTSSRPSQPQCCCKDCIQNIGYFRNIPNYWLVTLSQCWRPKSGFLGKNGCRIPRKFRSSTCLTYHCQSSCTLGKKNLAILRAIDHLMI